MKNNNDIFISGKQFKIKKDLVSGCYFADKEKFESGHGWINQRYYFLILNTGNEIAVDSDVYHDAVEKLK
jgi:hypothetical protein